MALPKFAVMLSMANYDTGSAAEYQLKYGASLDNSRGKSHRIPAGTNEGLILRPQWHPEFTIGLNHDATLGRLPYVDPKSNRIYTLDPDSKRAASMERLD